MEVGRSVRASSVAELFWTDPDGAPDGCGVVALSWGDSPAVAFTYAQETRARAAAAAPTVVLTLTERRSTSTAFTPLALIARPRLVEDVEGDTFTAVLLEEELRRYPPARKYADSPMLRREHWWYLPRLIVTLQAHAVRPVPARSAPEDHVLVVAQGGALDARVVHVGRPAGERAPLPLTPRDGSGLPAGPAALVGQDASFPDLEQWASWCFRGHCDGRQLRPTQWPDAVGLPAVPTLWQRVRHQRRLGRACREGITRAERRLPR